MDESQGHEILEAINIFSRKVDERFKKVDERFAQVHKEMAQMRAEMATKDFVDRRFNQLEAKIGTLTNTLENKRVITQDQARDVMIAS